MPSILKNKNIYVKFSFKSKRLLYKLPEWVGSSDDIENRLKDSETLPIGKDKEELDKVFAELKATKPNGWDPDGLDFQAASWIKNKIRPSLEEVFGELQLLLNNEEERDPPIPFGGDDIKMNKDLQPDLSDKTNRDENPQIHWSHDVLEHQKLKSALDAQFGTENLQNRKFNEWERTEDL